MKKIVELQNGLDDLKAFLEAQGYECFLSGTKSKHSDVLIVSVSDDNYEGITTTSCMQEGSGKKTVINAAKMDRREIIRMIEHDFCH